MRLVMRLVLARQPGLTILCLHRIGKQIRFPERQAAYIIRQLLSAIAYLHALGESRAPSVVRL